MKQQTQSQEALASAPLWPLMLRLALPAVVAQLVNALYNNALVNYYTVKSCILCHKAVLHNN